MSPSTLFGRLGLLAGFAAGLGSGPGSAPGPPPALPPETMAFVEEVRSATLRYHDQAAAIADGYRLIGDDFPGMGEHWIHIGLLFDGVYHAARPEFLSYARVGGKARLLGVAYALPLLEGEKPPDEPAGREAWHAHSGSLDEETFVPHHHVHSGHANHGPRLVMVHAWVWLANPEGLFAADNWAIPFLRLGLEPATGEDAVAAGKALSLLSGADAYAIGVVETAAATSVVDRTRVQAVVARTRASVGGVVGGRRGALLSAEQLREVALLWSGLWDAIEAEVPVEVGARLRDLAVR